MTLSYRRLTVITAVLISSTGIVPASPSSLPANQIHRADVNAVGEGVLSARALPQNCPGEDYSPCTCTNSPAGFYVSCVRVPYEQVKAVLSQSTTLVLDHLEILNGYPDIPENVTAGKLAGRLSIVGIPGNNQKLTCSPNAFTSTEAYTQVIGLREWDLSDHDFAYLDNFSRLEAMFSSDSIGFFNSWHTLPPLRNLRTLDVSYSENMGDLIMSPPELPSLQELKFKNDLLDDSSVAIMLDRLHPTSLNSVTLIELSTNQLTTIPSQLSSFSSLQTVHLNANFFRHLPSGSFNFHPSAPIQRVDVSNCRVEVIEPGAFIGDWGDTKFTLSDNILNRFEEAVFKGILQQMTVEGKVGYVDLSLNSIDCVTDLCHLEWLIVTNPALLKPIQFGRCSNGTRFEDLDAAMIQTLCSSPV